MEEDIKKEQNTEGGSASQNGGIDELEQCKKERDEYLDGWKRAKADLANYKKDELKHFEEFARWSQESLIREVIAVLDSFDLAILSRSESGQTQTNADLTRTDADAVTAERHLRGMYLIRNQLEDILRKNGLQKIVVMIGGKFDPREQEAIGEVTSDKPSGTIVEEVEPGYSLNGKVVRAARVRVAK